MRRVRVKVPKGRYHITSRINNREMFLECNVVKALFMAVVKRAQKKYKFVIYNFCMGTIFMFLKHEGFLQIKFFLKTFQSLLARRYQT